MKRLSCLVVCVVVLLGVQAFGFAQRPELVVQTGHTGDVTSVAFSSDGKLVASGGYDGTVRLWDAASGKLLRVFSEGYRPVKAVKVSPDSKLLVSTNDEGNTMLWDVKVGKKLRDLHIPGRNSAFDLAPDGKQLIISSEGPDYSIRLWDLATDQEIKLFNGHTERIYSVSFSPDGKTLVSGSTDHTVKLWDMGSGKNIRTLEGEGCFSVAFSPDGKMLAVGTFYGIKLFDIASGKWLKKLDATFQYSEFLTFSPDGKLLAAAGSGLGSGDESVSLWNVADGEKIKNFQGNVDHISEMAFSPDGKGLVGGSYNGTIKRWDVASGQELESFHGDVVPVGDVAFSPDKKLIACGGDDNTIKLWDIAKGKIIRTFEKSSRPIYYVAFSPNGKLLVSGSQNYTVKLWDVVSGRELKTFPNRVDLLRSVSFSPDGRFVVALGRYYIKVFDVESGEPLEGFDTNHFQINSVAFSPDGKWLAGASEDYTIKLWEISSGKEIKSFRGHTKYVQNVSFSLDGMQIVSSGGDRTVRLWDVTNGQEIKSFPVSADGVPVTFNSAGKVLIREEGTIKSMDTKANQSSQFALWSEWARVAGGQEIAIIAGQVVKAEIGDMSRAVVALKNPTNDHTLVTLTALDENDWAVVDPDGRFDASPGGMKQMHYVQGLEPIDLSRFKDGFYEPYLLSKVLGFNKEPLRAVPDMADVRLYPEITPKIEGDTLRVDLKNQGGGIGAVQVLVNGKELEADARGGQSSPTATDASLKVLLQGPMIKPGQENTIEVVAYNATGTVASRGMKVIYQAKGKAEVKPPHLYAIICGVSRFGDPAQIPTLRFAAKDARDMAQAISIAGAGLFGKENVHVTLLTGEAAPPAAEAMPAQAATKANLQRAFAEVAMSATPDDILLVYFSGHGQTLGQGSSTYCYLTQDAGTTELAGSPFLKDWTVTSDELAEWTKRIGALKQVLILDTCAAGKAAEKLAERRDVSSDAVRAIERMKDRVGFHVLMGSAADAVSYEASRYNQGLLTYALLEGMRGQSLRDDKFVDVSKWFDFAEDEVPKLAGSIGGIQKPQITSPQGSSFDIGELGTPEARAAIPLSVALPQILRPKLADENSPDLYDTLGLEKVLRAKLSEASQPSARGAGTLAFVVDATELPGAIAIGGRYKIEGDKVRVALGLRRDGKSIGAPLQIEGDKNDLPALAERIIQAINAAIKTASVA